VAVSDVVDIEEMVWAPRYGLKGQIDATLGLVLSDATHTAAAQAMCTQRPAPTGKGMSGVCVCVCVCGICVCECVVFVCVCVRTCALESARHAAAA
jgi:hypothetical protein